MTGARWHWMHVEYGQIAQYIRAVMFSLIAAGLALWATAALAQQEQGHVSI